MKYKILSNTGISENGEQTVALLQGVRNPERYVVLTDTADYPTGNTLRLSDRLLRKIEGHTSLHQRGGTMLEGKEIAWEYYDIIKGGRESPEDIFAPEAYQARLKKGHDGLAEDFIQKYGFFESGEIMKKSDPINPGMKDGERYKLLKDRVLYPAVADPSKVSDFDANALERLGGMHMKDARHLLKKLATEFGVFKDYSNTDIDMTVSFGVTNLNESLHKQNSKFDNFALMLTTFDDVVKNAVGIEVHKDRYGDEVSLKNMYVLASAFSQGEKIVPVKLEVKELNSPKQNTLYVAVSKSPFDMKKGLPSWGNQVQPSLSSKYPPVATTISIRRLFQNVNTSDADFLKYAPKQFLSRKQRKAAEGARLLDNERIKEKQAIAERKASFKGKKLQPRPPSHGPTSSVPPPMRSVTPAATRQKAKPPKGKGAGR
jgi:hypothetical protein